MLFYVCSTYYEQVRGLIYFFTWTPLRQMRGEDELISIPVFTCLQYLVYFCISPGIVNIIIVCDLLKVKMVLIRMHLSADVLKSDCDVSSLQM